MSDNKITDLEQVFRDGQVVYHKADPQQFPRVITGVLVRGGFITAYLTRFATNHEMPFQASELRSDIDQALLSRLHDGGAFDDDEFEEAGDNPI